MNKAKANFTAKTKVHFTAKTKVHFMGIGGSGMSAAAMIAKNQGYEVSGCDLLKSTQYLDKVKKSGIEVYTGHDKKHLDDVQILCVTPAVMYQNLKHEEVKAGENVNVMTWQKFLGNYLQKGKKVISISGTHGKSTTTTMVGLLYEKAGLDPNVHLGATVREWSANYRTGKSEIYINEADEFFDNFLNYHPEIIILNNIEFDHPDFFKSERHVIDTFAKFINNMTDSKTLIFNQDSLGIKKLFQLVGENKLSELNLIGYSLNNTQLIKTANAYKGNIIEKSKNGTSFRVFNESLLFEEQFFLKLPGDYNVSNALGVIALANFEHIETNIVKNILKHFSGTGRRMELIGEKSGIKVYDDYAHHPTAIKATLSGIRQIYPNNKIICIVEPHMFSRTKKLLSDYRGVFVNADRVVIAPIYRSRDTETFGISGHSIIRVADHKNIDAFDTSVELVNNVLKTVKYGNVIIVMGAGDSYQLAREILAGIK